MMYIKHSLPRTNRQNVNRVIHQMDGALLCLIMKHKAVSNSQAHTKTFRVNRATVWNNRQIFHLSDSSRYRANARRATVKERGDEETPSPLDWNTVHGIGTAIAARSHKNRM
jgi:hypothetical protein